MNRNMRILIIDDEAPGRTLLEQELKHAGFATVQAANAEEGLKVLHDQKPDVVLLDLNLPDQKGTDVCRQIRQDPSIGSVPILVLTGCDTQDLSASCLEGGADDFLQKPFNSKELVARLRAILRRPRIYAAEDSIIRKGHIEISRSERRVSIKGRPIEKLAPKEFELLSQLVLHSPRVLDKDVLAQKVWGTALENLNQRTLDVHVRRVRQKLGAAASCLKTVPAVGFQWLDGPPLRKPAN
jgi:two-component system, OmpR family, phosphate regulon response regulator PhoB